MFRQSLRRTLLRFSGRGTESYAELLDEAMPFYQKMLPHSLLA